MARILRIAAVALVLAASLAAAQSSGSLHEACYTGADGAVWRAYSDDSGTKFTRTLNGATETKSVASVPQMPPAGQPWTEGVQVANYLIGQNFFPLTKRVKSATWTRNDYLRTDVFNFTTAAGDSAALQTVSCAGANNCPSYRGGQGPHCFLEHEECCGANSMNPHCDKKDQGLQCCGWYLSSATCNSTQTCCGMLGPGASSYAFCCNGDAVCCNSMVGYSGTATCCPSGTTCCRASSVGVCCASDEVCEPNMNRCTKVTTSAPAVPETTMAPETTAAPNCLAWSSTSGATCTADEDCCGAGTMFPQCIPKNSGQQCCIHYKAATTCNSTQTCCGGNGPGASSYAFCCNEGSTCCRAMSSTQGASCCPSGTTCCAGASIGLCCASDEVCEPNMNRCTKASSTAPAVPAQ